MGLEDKDLKGLSLDLSLNLHGVVFCISGLNEAETGFDDTRLAVEKVVLGDDPMVFIGDFGMLRASLSFGSFLEYF